MFKKGLFLIPGFMALFLMSAGACNAEDDTNKIVSHIITLNERIAILERERAICEAMLRAQAFVDQKDFDKFILTRMGFIYARKGRIREAIESYTRALEYGKNDKNIHYNLGYLFAKEEKYKEAIKEYVNVLKESPQDREVYYNIAIIYSEGIKNLNTADKYYQKFLELSSTNNISIQGEP